MQRIRTVTPPTFCTELCPFEIFPMKNRVRSITLIPSRIFSCIFVEIYKSPSEDVQRTRTVTPPIFLRNYTPLKILLWKSCPLNNFHTVENIFMILCTKINHHETMCREQKPKFHLHCCGIMPLWNFSYKNRVRSITLIPLRIFSWNSVQI